MSAADREPIGTQPAHGRRPPVVDNGQTGSDPHGDGPAPGGRPAVSRRAVVTAGAGAAVCALAAACGTAAGPGTPAPPGVAGGAGSAGGAPGAPTAASEPAAVGLQAPQSRLPRPVAATSDIPVGGGRVFPDLRVVVTQPTAGDFRGFGIVCTHDQCELTGVADGTINCPCHGSRFALTDGSVVRGPARTGLRTEKLAVQGDRILLL